MSVSAKAQQVAEVLWPHGPAVYCRCDGDRNYTFASAALHGASFMADRDSDDQVYLEYLSETAHHLAFNTPARAAL